MTQGVSPSGLDLPVLAREDRWLRLLTLVGPDPRLGSTDIGQKRRRSPQRTGAWAGGPDCCKTDATAALFPPRPPLIRIPFLKAHGTPEFVLHPELHTPLAAARGGSHVPSVPLTSDGPIP